MHYNCNAPFVTKAPSGQPKNQTGFPEVAVSQKPHDWPAACSWIEGESSEAPPLTLARTGERVSIRYRHKL